MLSAISSRINSSQSVSPSKNNPQKRKSSNSMKETSIEKKNEIQEVHQKPQNQNKAQKPTALFSNFWRALSSLTYNIAHSNVSLLKVLQNKAEEHVSSNDFTAIKLHFVGIRNPVVSVSQMVEEFDEKLAKAQELNLIPEIFPGEIDIECESEDEETNDEKESTSQNANEKHREYWPVFHQIFSHSNGTTVDTASIAQVMNTTEEQKQDSDCVELLDDNARVESGKIAFKTLGNNLFLTSSVGDLKKRLRMEFDIPAKCKILLIYSHIILQDAHRTLKYYGLENNSFILICISEEKTEEIVEESASAPVIVPAPVTENNTSNQLSLSEVIQRQLSRFNGTAIPPPLRSYPHTKPLKVKCYDNLWSELNNFTLETMTDLDILTFEMNDNCFRMPCGHGMVPETLLEYCKMQFKEKQSIIKCPHMIKMEVESNDEKKNETLEIKEVQCNKEWKYPIIRRVIMAYLDKEKTEECTNGTQDMLPQKLRNTMKLELLAARNIVQEKYDLQRCGKCCTIFYREKQKLKDIVFQTKCPLCTQNNRRVAVHKFKQTMVRYEMVLKEFDHWKIRELICSFPARFSTIKRKLPKLGIIHQKPILFYHRENKRNDCTWDRNLKENMPELPSNFFRTASDSEVSEYDSDDSSIRIRYKLELNEILDSDGYESDTEVMDDEPTAIVIEEEESESSSSAVAGGMFGYDSDSSDDSSTVSVHEIAVEDEESSASSIAVRNIFERDSESESEDDSSSDSSAYELTADEIRISSQRLKRIIALNGGLREEKEIEQKAIVAIIPPPPPTLKEIFMERMKNKKDAFEVELESNHYSSIYCWGCGTVWSDASSLACGNPKCSTSYRAQIVQLLANAYIKAIGSVSDVPQTRACVNCCQLIQHWDGCKHMACRECNKSFCFICLKPYLDNGGWQCGNSSTICPVANRQGIECLPSANQSTVKLF